MQVFVEFLDGLNVELVFCRVDEPLLDWDVLIIHAVIVIHQHTLALYAHRTKELLYAVGGFPFLRILLGLLMYAGHVNWCV
jgi:hypothetical protein